MVKSVGNVEYVTNDQAEFKKINFSNLSGNLSIPDHSLSQSCGKYVKSLIELIIKKNSLPARKTCFLFEITARSRNSTAETWWRNKIV